MERMRNKNHEKRSRPVQVQFERVQLASLFCLSFRTRASPCADAELPVRLLRKKRADLESLLGDCGFMPKTGCCTCEWAPLSLALTQGVLETGALAESRWSSL